jgi:signal transduction histidine kinase
MLLLVLAMRILVVEDSATQAEALRALLEDARYDVTVATSGEAGLAAFEANACDVVISDVIMPGAMDGYELCRRIKETRRRDIPVVLLASLADPQDVVRALECGADNFLTQPYEPDHLLQRLETLLGTRVTRRQVASHDGVKVFVHGREFTVNAGREQILDLLVSTFEDAVRLNRELLRREAALETANKEIEALTYSISHDLRAPLRHADGFSEILLEECGATLGEEGQGYVKRIRDAIQHMNRMVSDLLNLGRMGRREVLRQSTELRPLVDAVVSELEGVTDGRRVEWQIGPLPRVECDPTLMQSVFANLLANAVKFTRGRDPAIIEVRESTIDGQSVIVVRDNGTGFDMQYADRLFGIFQRLHRAEEFEGTGMGLATVRRILNKHGGRIWAEGSPGKGATFYVALPSPETGHAGRSVDG